MDKTLMEMLLTLGQMFQEEMVVKILEAEVVEDLTIMLQIVEETVVVEL